MQEFMKVLAVKTGTTTTTYNFERNMNGIDIFNDSTTVSLTLTINNMNFVVLPNSSFSDNFENFNTVTVTISTTASHKLVVRGF